MISSLALVLVVVASERERERDSRTVSTNKVPSPSHGINACVHQPFENYLVHSVEGVLLGRQIHRPQISTSRSNLDTRKAPTRPAYATRNELHVTRGAVIEPEVVVVVLVGDESTG